MFQKQSLSHLGAVGVALLVTVLWSSSWVLIRWGLDGEGLPPITFAALRYSLAAILMVAWMFRETRGSPRRVSLPTRSMVLPIVLLGVFMYALTSGAQFVALDNQPAATTSLVLSWTPMLVAAVGVVSLGERPSGRQVLGTIIVVFGAWLYFAGDLGATAIGMTAALVGLGSNVTASVLGRGINRDTKLSPVVVTAYSMVVGAALLLIAGIAIDGLPSVTARAWIIIGWLAVVNTALAFTLWNLSLRRLTAVESAGINNTMLIQIAVLAWIFLDEAPGTAEAIGIVLVSIGVLLTQRMRAMRYRPADPISPSSEAR